MFSVVVVSDPLAAVFVFAAGVGVGDVSDEPPSAFSVEAAILSVAVSGVGAGVGVGGVGAGEPVPSETMFTLPFSSILISTFPPVALVICSVNEATALELRIPFNLPANISVVDDSVETVGVAGGVGPEGPPGLTEAVLFIVGGGCG